MSRSSYRVLKRILSKLLISFWAMGKYTNIYRTSGKYVDGQGRQIISVRRK